MLGKRRENSNRNLSEIFKIKKISSKHLHIVSFNVPFPANYGGVIDIFYKIKALHQLGIKIHLHCFQYGRTESKELEKYCESVNYYPRKNNFSNAFHYLPYIVASRSSEKLMQNILKNDAPILFEGLHSCHFLNDARIKNRLKIYRESNIEHHYYWHLFKSEKNVFKKIFFLSEYFKLLFYQKILKYSDLMLVVSEADKKYLHEKFPNKKIIYLTSFHGNEKLNSITGKGNYVLYHGNLSVAENENAAMYLLKTIFSETEIPFKIAGLNPSERLKKTIASFKNVELIENPDDAKMQDLVQQAHVHFLITFQATGLKLKLLNTLYNGRFCLVNKNMLSGTNLENVCCVADTAEEMKQKLKELFEIEFTSSEIEKRKGVLKNYFSDEENAKKINELIFG